MMIIERGNTKVCFCQETLAVTVEKDQTRWEWADGFQPKLICKEGSFSFLDAVTITHETYTMGVGIGIRSCFEGFEKDGVTYPYAFETLIWMEDTTEQVYFEWVPLKEEGLQVEKVLWPGQMAFEEKKDSWYTGCDGLCQNIFSGAAHSCQYADDDHRCGERKAFTESRGNPCGDCEGAVT